MRRSSKGATGRGSAELERLADKEPAAYAKIWDTFGAVLKEGIYEDFERRDTLLKLARFKTTASGDEWRSLKDYVGALQTNQTAIYYLAGDDLAAAQIIAASRGFPRPRHRSAAAARPGGYLLGQAGRGRSTASRSNR